MVPSSASIASANFTLNVIVAEVLSQIADKLEKAEDFNNEVQTIIKEIARDHSRVVFNGNNYSNDWIVEAEKRGLPNITNTVDSISALISDKCINLFEKHNVFTKKELESQYEISLEHYTKTINIEALTMLDMSKRQILPACINYMTNLADSINSVKATGVNADLSPQTTMLVDISNITASLKTNIAKLEELTYKAQNLHGDTLAQASYYRDVVFAQKLILGIFADYALFMNATL
jgi:glutamine synthetase